MAHQVHSSGLTHAANTKKDVSQITWYVSHIEQAKEFSLQNVLYIYVDEEEICKYSPLSALKHSTEFRSSVFEKKPDETQDEAAL